MANIFTLENVEDFSEKLNIFIALAPIVQIKNTINYSIRFTAKHLRLTQFLVEDVLRLYNILPPSYALNMGQVVFCSVFKGLCDLAVGRIVDREVQFDNMDRSDVYYSMFPSGAGYKNWFHYL